MGYTVLERENLPDALKQASKKASCLVILTGFLVMTMTAITIGAVFGYTYCYIERRCIDPSNYTYFSSYQLFLPDPDCEKARDKNTSTEALIPSVFVSRIMKIGHALLNDTGRFQPDKLESIGAAVAN